MKLLPSTFGFSGTCSDNSYSESSLESQRVVIPVNPFLWFPVIAEISHLHQKFKPTHFICQCFDNVLSKEKHTRLLQSQPKSMKDSSSLELVLD